MRFLVFSYGRFRNPNFYFSMNCTINDQNLTKIFGKIFFLTKMFIKKNQSKSYKIKLKKKGQTFFFKNFGLRGPMSWMSLD